MARPQNRGRALAALAVLLALTACRTAAAQLPDFGGFRLPATGDGEKVRLTAEFTPAADSRPALLFVTAEIAPGFHVSALDQGKSADGGGPLPTAIALAPNSPVSLLSGFRPLEPPKVRIDQKAWVGLELREHEGRSTWVAPIEIPPGTDAATLALEGTFEAQACSSSTCVPVSLAFTARQGRGTPVSPDLLAASGSVAAAQPKSIGAAGGAGTGEMAQSPAQPKDAGLDTDSAVDANSSLWLVAAYGVMGGLILNLMPCVLPVLGLKLLSFAKQGGESRRRIFTLNLAYTAGLLTVFAVLATLAALVQLGLGAESYGWGELFTLSWFKVPMTALVFAMALAFLGVWEIPIPGFAASGKATEMSAQEGPVGAFCMGVFTTLLATPCSGPFLGPVFGYTITQPPVVTYLVFGSVGVGMALPYLLVGAFPSLVAWLPKPGAWMDTLKQLLGFVLLATVVYLFSTLSQELFLPTLALLFSIWFGCWIVGRAPAWAETAYKRKEWLKGVVAATVIGGASFVMLSPSDSELAWQPYSPEALATARAQGKTVLVDFTANWCPTCKLNLKAAINRAEVRELIERNGVVPLLADWTDKNDTIKQALAELNSLSIPLMAIYPADPQAEVLVLPDLLTQSQVIAALEKAGPSIDAVGGAAGPRTASRLGVANER